MADSETITVNDQVSMMVSQTITFGPAPTAVVGGSGALSDCKLGSASITPATYTFANQQVDTTSAPQSFTYSDRGLVSITVPRFFADQWCMPDPFAETLSQIQADHDLGPALERCLSGYARLQ